MKLGVGITSRLPEWELLLRQIGIPFYEMNVSQPFDHEALAVVIVNWHQYDAGKENILRYLNSGGAVLTEADSAKTLLKMPVKKTYIKYLCDREDSLFAGIPVCDLIPARREIAAESQYLKNQHGVSCAAVMNYGAGKIVVLPAGFCANRLKNQSRRKNFPREGGERFPNEKVSRVSGGVIRQIVQTALEHLFHFRGLPFARLWPLPEGQEKLFGFRVDTDFGAREEVEALYRICRKNNIRATWFMETKSPVQWINFYREMENQEIGYHCYRHRTFADYQSNVQDIQRGLRILHDAGIRPAGYAAPFGEWHPVLGKAVQDMGFQYSSEFAAGYDDLPFYPFLGSTFSPVLQVPIHPISVGRLLWARHSPQNMLDYYRRVIAETSARREPVFIYHHPGHGHFDLFDTLFGEINYQNIPTMSLGEYANWWGQRNSVTWEAVWTERKVKIRSNSKDASIWVSIHYPDQKTTLLPVFPEGAPAKTLPETSGGWLTNDNAKEMRKYYWRMLLADLFWLYGKWKQ